VLNCGIFGEGGGKKKRQQFSFDDQEKEEKGKRKGGYAYKTVPTPKGGGGGGDSFLHSNSFPLSLSNEKGGKEKKGSLLCELGEGKSKEGKSSGWTTLLRLSKSGYPKKKREKNDFDDGDVWARGRGERSWEAVTSALPG